MEKGRSSTNLSLILITLLAGLALGWLLRDERSDWYAWIAGGAAALVSVVVLALAGAVLAPAVARRTMVRWSAVVLPGHALSCRVCGGLLPSAVQPVLRCGYCGAELALPAGGRIVLGSSPVYLHFAEAPR